MKIRITAKKSDTILVDVRCNYVSGSGTVGYIDGTDDYDTFQVGYLGGPSTTVHQHTFSGRSHFNTAHTTVQDGTLRSRIKTEVFVNGGSKFSETYDSTSSGNQKSYHFLFSSFMPEQSPTYMEQLYKLRTNAQHAYDPVVRRKANPRRVQARRN